MAGEARRRRFWPADVHIIGKDIIWFHCVIWPCMLWSAGLPLPKTVFGHGFVTASDGQKMSKSIGNVVDPMEQLAKYSSDTFRYYLMRTGVYGSDIPFSESNLVYVHNSDLADVMGNLVHRATNLCSKNCGGAVPAIARVDVVFDVAALRVQTELAMKSFEVQRCCELAINAMKDTNKYLTDSAPWAVKGEEAAERKAVIIRSTLEAVYAAAHFLSPFIPDATDAIFQKLGTPATPIWKLKSEKNLAPGTEVRVGEILFAKHEVEEAGAAGKGAGEKKGGDKKAADGKAAAPRPKPKKTPAAAAWWTSPASTSASPPSPRRGATRTRRSSTSRPWTSARRPVRDKSCLVSSITSPRRRCRVFASLSSPT